MKTVLALILLALTSPIALAIDTTRIAPEASHTPATQSCQQYLEAPRAYPREIDPAKTFESLVQWIHDDLIVEKKAPGLVVGISGTDSVVVFLAAAKAFEMAGQGDRVAGVHFGPSEDFLYDHPEASAHLWFQEAVIPWLKQQAPQAQLVVDGSIDFRRDGLRWGALMEWSVTDYPATARKMRLPRENYWVVGTRNATEQALGTYSNASTIASVQPITHLWKSEILKISEYLGMPKIAVDKACEVDCVCGRLRLPATHIPEVDALIMMRQGLLKPEYVEKNIAPELRKPLMAYIESQLASSQFKKQIPYTAEKDLVKEAEKPLLGRLDQYGSGFASWRFLTQAYDGKPALAEQFGMRKLIRENDIRDATLPPSNPDRDELGRGFVWQSEDLYIEYRRAYIVVSSLGGATPATLVIRNNSKYFGHDRLKNAVYFSDSGKTPAELESLTPRTLEDPTKFFAVRAALTSEQSARIQQLLDKLDEFNQHKDQWINSNPEALAFLASKSNERK